MSLLLARAAAVAATAVTALSAATGGSGASAVVPRGCPPPHARVLAGSHTARVFVMSAGAPALGPPAMNYFACTVQRGRSIALGSSAFGRTRVGAVGLAGNVVAYAITLTNIDTASSSVRVLDLASGRRLRDLPATSTPLGVQSFTTVSAVVVTPTGAVAWIAQNSGIRRPVTYEVHRADRSGTSLLASGPAIRATSLRLSGRVVSWQDGGRTSSAPLR